MHKTITIEGQDQIGKADATKELVKYLRSRGSHVTQITYPYYSLPIGAVIRQFLMDMDRLRNISGLKNSIGESREVEIIGVFFAINRLETLSSVRTTLNDIDNGYLVSDRGPYSMALTFAYGVSSGLIKESDVDRLIDLSLDFDKTFRNALRSDENIIQFRSEGDIFDVAQGSRRDEKVDVYEKPEIQMFSREIYKRYQERLEKWKDVVTRIDGEGESTWRPREEILSEVVSIIENENDEVDLQTKAKTDLPEIITPDIPSKLQYGVDIGKSNMILLRKYYSNGEKEKSFNIESDIGMRIARETSPSKINWEKEASTTISRLVEQYPEIYLIIEEFLGQEFRETFQQSVNRG